jgi:type II secretory pathway component PulF
MADSEWVSATTTLLVAVVSLVIFKSVLIPQIKELFKEVKPAITGLVSGLKKVHKGEEKEEVTEE